jgi:mannose-6-phosphate isomerase-like protein (cupin superfamily)
MSAPIRDRDLATELHDIFHVTQLTRDTDLESRVGVDHVTVEPGQTSQIHRHNRAETVLYISAGAGTVVIEDVDHAVTAGDRVRIRPGEYHGVRTGDQPLTFISVQSPPILDQSTGTLDLEPRGG